MGRWERSGSKPALSLAPGRVWEPVSCTPDSSNGKKETQTSGLRPDHEGAEGQAQESHFLSAAGHHGSVGVEC